MTDTDAIIRDSATAKAKALIEFKHANLQQVDLSSWQTKALRSDASDLNVPLFVVVYYHLDSNLMPIDSYKFIDKASFGKVDSDLIRNQIAHSQYFVIAGNDLAKVELQTSHKMLNEHDFFDLQARLTNTKLKRTLSTTIVDVDTPAVIN